MGWSPYEYFTALPGEFYAAYKGYDEKTDKAAKILRFAAFRVAEAVAGSKAIGSIENFWPMEKKDKPKVEPMTRERYEAMIKRHKLKVK